MPEDRQHHGLILDFTAWENVAFGYSDDPKYQAIKVGNKDYILMATDISSLTRSSLGEKVTNVEKEYRQTVIEALDILFQGF